MPKLKPAKAPSNCLTCQDPLDVEGDEGSFYCDRCYWQQNDDYYDQYGFNPDDFYIQQEFQP